MILRKNTFLHQSRASTCNPKPLLHDINVHAKLKKIGQKLLKLQSGNDIFTSKKGHNSVVYKRTQPICNPKPHFPDINVHTKFEENRSKLLKLEYGNEALTDGQTLEWFGVYNINGGV